MAKELREIGKRLSAENRDNNFLKDDCENMCFTASMGFTPGGSRSRNAWYGGAAWMGRNF